MRDCLVMNCNELKLVDVGSAQKRKQFSISLTGFVLFEEASMWNFVNMLQDVSNAPDFAGIPVPFVVTCDCW